MSIINGRLTYVQHLMSKIKIYFLILLFLQTVSLNGQSLWSTTGNTGLINLKPVLGNLDSVDFNLITNNISRFTLKADGNVGIGSSASAARLQIDNGAMLLTGTSGTIKFNGSGTRMMWLPIKGAIRAGNVTAGQWDIDSIGTNSTAFGLNTKASGNTTTAMGYGSQATGSYAMAFGVNTIASGKYSTAFGVNNITSGDNSFALGVSNVSSGKYSVSMGSYAFAIGNFSTAWGIGVTSKASGSFAFGRYNVGNGDPVNWVGTDPVFEIGNGTKTVHSNALTVLKNGNMGISVSNPSYKLQLSSNSAAKPGSGTWKVASDRRLKDQVKPFTDGLQTVRNINPVTFHYNGKEGLPTDEEFVGIIAQEMNEIAPYMIKPYIIYDDAKKETREYLSYDPNALFYILINSVKELAATNDHLNKELKEIKNQNQAIIERLDQIEHPQINIPVNETNKTNPFLTPDKEFSEPEKTPLSIEIQNPTSNEITITGYIPPSVSNAEIIITASDGSTLKVLLVTERGFFRKNIPTTSFAAGMYNYTLIGDAIQSVTSKGVHFK